MTYDLKIKGGTIVDGTGAPRFTGDIGITDGHIMEVGKLSGHAKREVDADGATVMPGFTDLHTHYDGQVSWDADLAPTSLHGVTTAVMGNCGVGFAPCRPQDHERLISLMEGVEDIPGTALAEGLTWNWESLPEYMDAIDGFAHAIDYCVQVPHDPLRVFVMGERAIAGEDATPDDIKQMAALARESIMKGAIGFSTGRSDNHRTAEGDMTPASEASVAELVGIAKGLSGLQCVLQAVSDFDMSDSDERFDGEFDVIEAMARESGLPLSMSLIQRDQSPKQWERILGRVEKADAAGMTMRVQVGARALGVMLGLTATFHPFMGFPSFKKICHLPLAEQVKRMSDVAFMNQLLTEKSEPVSGDGSSIPPLADMLLANIDMMAMRLYELGDIPNYEPEPASCIYYQAVQQKKPVLQAVYEALLKKGGKELLYFPLLNYTEMNLNNVHKMLTHPLALSGLSDGGAHVGTVCDASFPTFLMTHWGRDRAHDRIPLEKLVKMQAHDTSRFIGLTDRGTLKPGQRADINIVDYQNLKLLRPELHADLPAGGKRLMQNAEGYIATMVKGINITEHGKLTGNRPGRLART